MKAFTLARIEPARALDMLTWLLLLAAIASAPRWLDPSHFPIAAWLLLAALLGIPAFLADRGRPAALPLARRINVVLPRLGLLLGVWAAAEYLWAQASSFGGVDLFYYLNYARDLNAADSPVHHARYAYFPGVYRFWSVVLAATGPDFSAITAVYFGVLLVDSALVAWIVGRASGRALAGGYAGVLTLFLFSRFEGFVGTTEPVAVLPVLVAVAIWGGRPLAGRQGAGSAVALGLGIGLAVAFKQQAGLLSLGWLGLFSAWARAPVMARHRLGLLLLVPALAGLTLAIAIGAEGEGILPLATGVAFARAYAAHGRPLRNLWEMVGPAWTEVLMAIFALVVWARALYARARDLDAPDLGLIGFSAIAGLLSLAQAFSRPYLHYGLLGLPFLVIALALGGLRIGRRLADHFGNAARARYLGLVVAAIPLLENGRDAAYLRYWPIPHARPSYLTVLYLWPISLGAPVPVGELWHLRPGVAEDLAAVKKNLLPREPVLVLPPRMTAAHWFLDTRAPASFEPGYNWVPDPSAVERALLATDTTGVLVTAQRDADDQKSWQELGGDRLAESLEARGWVPAVVRPTMTLFRRKRSEVQELE